MVKNFTLLFVTLFTTALTAQVTLSLQNKTGEDLHNVKLWNREIGTIEKGSVKVITFESISADNGQPYFSISLFYKHYPLTNLSSLPRCGNSSKTIISQGDYILDIKVLLNEQGRYTLITREYQNLKSQVIPDNNK
ncbi:hypothetical protein GR160_16240 [Flavobacterium sp. Sd200]|uniref:hypothetical protein n=1 Tax=Flavobacterium sp. Sd200 TaxID=2692211 RepID=UPI00136D90A4|nr:hypothetical protein [Flavobacterium sp. Sd200]MXN92779.1 hypothetical protein [Flavobacterium sp. Sd200]